MEDKIEVGEYVRTKRGIGKILEIKTVQPKMYGKHDVVYLIDKCPHMYITDIEFIKHSKNIIDLIEVGDYENGYKVLVIEKHFQVQPYRINIMVYKTKDAEFWISLEEETIEDIVTKEQFESVKYKV